MPACGLGPPHSAGATVDGVCMTCHSRLQADEPLVAERNGLLDRVRAARAQIDELTAVLIVERGHSAERARALRLAIGKLRNVQAATGSVGDILEKLEAVIDECQGT